MTSSLREKAKELLDNTRCYNSPTGYEDLIEQFTEALEAAYKQGALARVELPERKSLKMSMRSEELAKNKAWNACLDAIKVTPLTAEDILPSDDWIESEYEKFDNDKSRTQDHPTYPEWVASEHDYWMESYKMICKYIRNKLAISLQASSDDNSNQ